MIEQLAKRYAKISIRSFLDLGCGTGNHAIPLARRGYEVWGIDRSEEMLAKARQKSSVADLNGKISFHQADLRREDLPRQFDVVLMMFAVLGYQKQNEDVLDALKAARHLLPGGVLLFDVWYGPAALAQRPTDRMKVVATEQGEILRSASGVLDVQHHLCNVRYDVWQVEGDRIIARTQEDHVMRYFFPLELELFLEYAGFRAVKFAAFPDEGELDERTWNLLGIAQTREINGEGGFDPWYYRPAEVDLLVGDASKARKKLNWQPKTTFKELVRLMLKRTRLC